MGRKKFGSSDFQQLHLQLVGGLAQLARALAWHARGRRFDPDTLHSFNRLTIHCGLILC